MRDLTFIVELLDRSGSMEAIKGDTIGGHNTFLKTQKEVGANALFTLVQFDSQGIDTVYESRPIREVPELTEDTYLPRASTPLIDAMATTIQTTGKTLSAMPEADRPDKVVFVVITDGLENASRQFSSAQLKEMVEHQEKVYKWNFIYLGANQDAFAEAAKIGVDNLLAANFRPDNVMKAYAVASSNVANYRGSGQSADLHWTDKQRRELMGDDEQEEAVTK